MPNIYARTEWYRARSESEQSWEGVLEERHAPVGPASRSALRYTLVVNGSQFPVYAPDLAQKLAPFVRQRVMVRGKLVDLREEGFEQELWIASIRPMEL
jgi:hypothetical protein